MPTKNDNPTKQMKLPVSSDTAALNPRLAHYFQDAPTSQRRQHRAAAESDIQRAIIDALVLDGWLVVRVNSGGATFGDGRYVRFVRWVALGFEESDAGVADVLAFKDGKGLLVEVKATGGKVRPSQSRFSSAAEQAGAVYVVAGSIDDLQPYLDRLEIMQ